MNEHGNLSGMFTPHDLVMDLAAQRCMFIFGGRPKGFTCLDYQADYDARPEGYGDPLATEMKERRHFCWSCAARDALGRTPFALPPRKS